MIDTTTKQEDGQPDISLANKMINQMRRKVEEEDRKFYVIKQRRNQSEDNFARWDAKAGIATPLLMPEEKESILEHP